MHMREVSAADLFYEGSGHLEAGHADRAEACWRAALALDPQMAEVHANLAFLHDERGEWTQAQACYQRALALQPDRAQLHLNYGTLLAGLKRLDEAEAAYTRAIQLEPQSAGGWSNLGGLYAGMKRDAEAELCCRQALARDPEHAKARFNLAYVLLRQGRYEEGWPCLEARDWYGALQAQLKCPRWQGEPLLGRSVLIGPEAGYGDMIQFVRYAPLLRARGAARITILCPPALKPLLLTLAGVDEVLAWDDAMPAAGWDCWTPLLSLPLHCGTRLTSIPAQLPYLAALPARSDRWHARLPATGRGLRVGLVWKGNPRFENDADRSLPALDVLVPLGKVPGVQFVSLQKGEGEDEALDPPSGLPLLHLGSQIEDFADTAAIVAELDLVICVDTAVAHLAGALGRPCWVLLPYYKTDWRWLEQRGDSPWYPGVMRLFRQSASGDWAPVIDAVAQALEAFRHVAADAAHGTP
jgi:Tfp pilus assembly protein PilF